MKTWLRWMLGLAVLGLCGAVMLLSAAYLYLGPQLPPAAQLREVSFQIPLRVYSSDGRLIGEFGEQRRTPVQYEQIPEPLILAILSAEDDRFFRHHGVDPKGLARAASELLRYREIRSGGSTITMQVARNFFLSREQSFLRKFNEIILALQIERLVSKQDVLELYVNKIYLGHRAYGVAAAAQVYYGRTLDQLTLAQMAMIAGLPKAPSLYNPITNPVRALQRRDWILHRMHEHGHISDEALQEALAEPNSARLFRASLESEGQYVAEMARQHVLEQFGERIYTDGLRIVTTLDSRMQDAAVTALRHGLQTYDERHGWRGPEQRVDIDDLPPLDFDRLSAPADEEAARALAADLNAWSQRLRGQHRYGDLEPALVARVSDAAALVVLPEGRLGSIELEQMRWARPYRGANSLGDAPRTATDVLRPGDLVRVRPVGGERPVWRLAQVPAAQSALVALHPRTGAILALQGGYSFGLSSYNRAVQARRQAGSVFKPFVYTAGLQNGITPATLFNDAPVVFQDSRLSEAWRPTGASSRFYGPTRVREALYRSLNLVSIRLLQQVGLSTTFTTLEQFGLPTDRFQRDLSIALGSATVTPLEMARAYAVFANGGYLVQPWFVERIEDHQGNLIWQAPRPRLCDEDGCQPAAAEHAQAAEAFPVIGPAGPDPEAVDAPPPRFVLPQAPDHVDWPRTVDARTVWLMDSMLQDVVQRGTAASARALQRTLAGKTGSTNDHLDAWFSGYAPNGLVAINWVGFDTPATLGYGEYGGKVSLPIWIDFMRQALPTVPERPLAQPEGIVSARINAATGHLAQPGDSDALFEFFKEEEAPEPEYRYVVPGYEGDEPQVRPEELF